MSSSTGLLLLSSNDYLRMEMDIASEESDINSISIRLIAGEEFQAT
jgi:hypothetical protein